ncbi:MFS transporter [Streptomyces sp. NPDC058653]|uniref:MFS transporter n=1 Tax=Streptomyces sp. NPDC058653 TaxID=3346576 RepID=UPI0036508062
MRPPARARHERRPVPGLVWGVYLPRAADAGAFSLATYGIPMLVLATTGSAVWTGLAFAMEWIPRLAVVTFAGTLVDRHGPARVFRLACILRALVVLAVAVVLPVQSGGTEVTAMVLAAASGGLNQFSYVAAETTGADVSRRAGSRAHRVQSVLLGVDQTALLAGPALAGLLVQWTGSTGLLTMCATFSLLAAVLTPRQLAPRKTSSPADAVPAPGLRTGWTVLRRRPALAWLVGGLAVSNLSVGVLQAATPVIVVRQLGYSTGSVGLIWSAAAVASLLVVAACRAAISRWGLWPVGAVSATVAAGACLAVAQATTYSAYLVLVAVLMAGEGGLTMVLRTLRSHLIPAQVFGATLALTILLLLAPFPLAGLLVAAVPPDRLGHALGVCAVVQALALTVTFARVRTLPGLRPTRL